MNLSTPVDEGYRELVQRVEELVESQIDRLYDEQDKARTGMEEFRISQEISALESWQRDLEILRNREAIERGRLLRAS